jgi:Outer membrane protein beta-barrel domain
MQRKMFVQMVGILLTLFLISLESFAQIENHPIEVGGFLTAIDLRDTVGEKPLGFGGRLTYNLTNNFALDSEAAYFPENPSGNFGQTTAFAGLRAGVRRENFGVFAKVRPGVLRLGGDFFRTYNKRSHNNVAIDLGGVLELYPSRRVIVRVDLGDTIVPFGSETINGPLPPYTIRPGTTHNFQGSFGIGFRF